MRRLIAVVCLVIVISSMACSVLSAETAPGMPEAEHPQSTQRIPVPDPTAEADPAAHTEESIRPEGPNSAEEAILIREPGPGSLTTSPLHLAGISDSTFEQTLVVRLVRRDGSLLLEQPIQINAESGERGPFEADLLFEVNSEENILLQVMDLSARDGGIVHLSSVVVTLKQGGANEIAAGPGVDEQIRILRPVPGDVLEGGRVLVEGFGRPSFENTLVVKVYDADGGLVGTQPCTTSASEPGETGWFSVEVEYNVASEGPGRVTVVDPLPLFDGIGHAASVPVTIR